MKDEIRNISSFILLVVPPIVLEANSENVLQARLKGVIILYI